MPASSTGTATTASPPRDDRRRYSASDGSSTAIRRAPRGAQRPRDQPEALGEPGADHDVGPGRAAVPADPVEVRRRGRSAAPGRRARRGSEKRSLGASASTRRIDAARRRAGTRSRRAGRAGSRTAQRGHREVARRTTGVLVAPRATRVAPPGRLSRGSPRRPAARTPRRRSRATRRAGRPAPASTGSAVPAASRPSRIAARRPASSCRWSGSALVAVERHEQLDVRTGPRSSHRTGPYQRTGRDG